MKIYFWGVRGSVPTPLTSQQIQSKIIAAVQRISSKDIETTDSRERFVSSLPEWIFGTTGGNTPCVEIVSDDETQIILDAGTGIRCFGKSDHLPKDKHYNLFFSHFHWDHIQGLPFFDAIYDKNSTLEIFSAVPEAEKLLKEQQRSPFFPENASFESLASKINFHTAQEGKSFFINNVEINTCKMSHPGNSHSFSFSENGKKIVYATDVELTRNDFIKIPSRAAVFENADLIVLDSQYTVEESYRKENWGHSAFCYAIDFAAFWNIKRLVLFHHEPVYDDKKLDSILQAARWYAKFIAHKDDMEIMLATENQEIVF